MAGHLAKAGHEVTVYNRTTSVADKWVNIFGGKKAPSPADAAKDADIVITCVGNDNDLKEVVLGEHGVFSTMNKGSILIDHTTTSALIAKAIYKEAKYKNIEFMDAPVSGGQSGAENGILTIMCGGNHDLFQSMLPVLSTYSQTCKLIGENGSGQLAKMVNQICIAGVVQGLAEALNFGINAGLECENVLEVIANGAAGSWQMSNRGKTMLNNEYDFGFAVDWMRKDLGFCLDEANRNNTSLPLVSMVDQFYKELQNMGGGRLDTSSLLYRLRKISNPETI